MNENETKQQRQRVWLTLKLYCGAPEKKQTVWSIENPLSPERTQNLLIIELHRAPPPHTLSHCVSSRFLSGLPSNLFPPAAVSISAAERALPTPESHAWSHSSSFAAWRTMEGPQNAPPSPTLIGRKTLGLGVGCRSTGRRQDQQDLTVTLICWQSRWRNRLIGCRSDSGGGGRNHTSRLAGFELWDIFWRQSASVQVWRQKPGQNLVWLSTAADVSEKMQAAAAATPPSHEASCGMTSLFWRRGRWCHVGYRASWMTELVINMKHCWNIEPWQSSTCRFGCFSNSTEVWRMSRLNI